MNPSNPPDAPKPESSIPVIAPNVQPPPLPKPPPVVASKVEHHALYDDQVQPVTVIKTSLPTIQPTAASESLPIAKPVLSAKPDRSPSADFVDDDFGYDGPIRGETGSGVVKTLAIVFGIILLIPIAGFIFLLIICSGNQGHF